MVTTILVVSIPFIAGQWSLPATALVAAASLAVFQSPSLRGSGRFITNRWRRRRCAPCFNPLHCGAVVASCRWPGRFGLARPVSIPFIAGQWSLRGARRNKVTRTGCFNPLHCGAVVASRHAARRCGSGRPVSIPFIAGQWSLQISASPASTFTGMFQSPSLRGSGRFLDRPLERCARY